MMRDQKIQARRDGVSVTKLTVRVVRRALLATTVVGFAVVWVLSASASAFTEPGITGGYPDFANCPVTAILAVSVQLSACEHSYTRGGVVQIGHSAVPISIPGDTFDLGVTALENHGSTVSPAHGILNGPAQPVPGGLLGSVGNTQLTGVSAKLEWAATVPPNSAFGFTEGCTGTDPLVTFDSCRVITGQLGTSVTLRAKIHLMSPFLGSTCYIGSAANPIVMALTTGTTSPPPPALPIHGTPLSLLSEPSPAYDEAINLKLVNNSFAVPAATGCGTSGGELVDASINHKLGLPSPPGQNMIAIVADAEQAPAKAVLAHGWTGE